MIGVIDYKAGNAMSVINALEFLKCDAKLIKESRDFLDVNGIILPGVGSARATMESLAELNMLESLKDEIQNKAKPFFGICVGLQVLFDYSEEDDTTCMGLLKGRVIRFSKEGNRVPQIGWNSTNFMRTDKIIKGLDMKEYFYFVNSYYVISEDENIVLGTTDYGVRFCSFVSHDNIYATQFHIEKSAKAGLTILKNFADIACEKELVI